MKRVTLLVFMLLVLAASAAGCRLVAPTPDPAEIERLVAVAVRATIEAMPTATPYPTYTPLPSAPTYTPRPTHTVVSGTSVTRRLATTTPGAQHGTSGTLRTHVVVAGDTLSALAKEYGTTVEAIMEANGLTDPGLIIVDQELAIPVGEAGSTSTPRTDKSQPQT